MNILTDVLSLIRRGIFAKTAKLDDVIILGVNEKPDMTGVASPIPYKSIKVIKVRDFKVAAEHCDHANSPAIPAAGTGQVYQKTVTNEETEKCTVYFRSLKSMSSNLTLAIGSLDNYVEITTTGEPNTAANLGSGIGVWKDKVGETLNFKTLKAGNNITITTDQNEITVNSTATGVPYTTYLQLLTQNGTSPPTGPVLENTAGITITWAYNTTGQYVATYSTALADINKAAITCSQTVKTASGGVIVNLTSSFATTFNITTTNTGGTGVNSQLLGAVLEIRIYP